MRIKTILVCLFFIIGCMETADVQQWHRYENRDQFISPKCDCVHVPSDGWTILGPVDQDLFLYQWAWQVTVKTDACGAAYRVESLEYVIYDKEGVELARNALLADKHKKPLLPNSSTTYQQTSTISGSKTPRAADGRFVLKLGAKR